MGRARQARRGRQPGAGGLGRRGDLRMVRAERRLVQQAQTARVAAAGAAAPVRADVALPPSGQDRGREPGDLREQALRAADPGADRLARGEGGDHPERHRRRPAGPAQAGRRPVPPGPDRHRPLPQAPGPGPGRAGGTAPRGRPVLAVHQVGDAVGALVGVAEPGRTRALRRRAAPGAACPAAARGGGVRRRGTGRRGLAAPGRLHAVHQRRRELPRRPGRGDGVAGGAGAAALAGRRDHLRHALDPPEPRGTWPPRSPRSATRRPGGARATRPTRRSAPRSTCRGVCEAWRGLLTTDLDPAVPGPMLELLGSG